MSRRMLTKREELRLARYSLLYIVAFEEAGPRCIFMDLARAMRKLLFEWSINDALRSVDNLPQRRGGGKREILQSHWIKALDGARRRE